VIDGSPESLQLELEHIERRRGDCTNIQRCGILVDEWRTRGRAAANAGEFEEFTRGLLNGLVGGDGSPLAFPAVGENSEWPPTSKVARAVWESCTGICLKKENGEEERYVVPLPTIIRPPLRQIYDLVTTRFSLSDSGNSTTQQERFK
jgi:hypothetical protein